MWDLGNADVAPYGQAYNRVSRLSLVETAPLIKRPVQGSDNVGCLSAAMSIPICTLRCVNIMRTCGVTRASTGPSPGLALIKGGGGGPGQAASP